MILYTFLSQLETLRHPVDILHLVLRALLLPAAALTLPGLISRPLLLLLLLLPRFLRTGDPLLQDHAEGVGVESLPLHSGPFRHQGVDSLVVVLVEAGELGIHVGQREMVDLVVE